MRCPNCGQENAETSAFCFECGARLRAEASTPGRTPVSPEPASEPAPPTEPAPSTAPSGGGASSPAPAALGPATAPAPPEVLRPGFPRSEETVLTHTGELFGLGYGPDYYAVWDLRKAGEPVARFDTSPIGWEAAWRRFHELERSHGIPAWRRPEAGWILLHVAIGLIVLAFLQGFVLGFVSSLAGKDLGEFTRATGWGIAVMVFTGLTAWLLFIFLRRSAVVRWIVFLGLLGTGFAVALILALATQPSSSV